MLETPAFNASRIAERFEAALVHARQSAEAQSACREVLSLYMDPDIELFQPAAWLKDHVAEFTTLGFHVHLEPIHEDHVGDPTKMLACLRALAKNIAAQKHNRLAIELFEELERGTRIPIVALELESPATLPETVVFGGCYPMPLAELELCWPLASSGGRMDRKGNGAQLRIKGMRLPAAPLTLARQLHDALNTPAAIDAALAVLDGPERRDPSDLPTVVRDVLDERAKDLDTAGIARELVFAENLPPIAVWRARLRTFFAILCDYALWTMPEGGKCSLIAEYDATKRQASLLLTLDAAGTMREGIQLPALERIANQLGGTFESDADTSESLITLTLPDTVGHAVDAWIPGWERFGARPRQMLRLLKSGGQTPPEDLILGGVLEEELERWLLPRLDTPAAINIAHELKPYNADLENSHPERLKKALEQVARGKPKKEICQPQYAGELIWAFSQTDRQRAVLSASTLEREALHTLSAALLETPLRYVEALRILAKIHNT